MEKNLAVELLQEVQPAQYMQITNSKKMFFAAMSSEVVSEVTNFVTWLCEHKQTSSPGFANTCSFRRFSDV